MVKTAVSGSTRRQTGRKMKAREPEEPEREESVQGEVQESNEDGGDPAAVATSRRLGADAYLSEAEKDRARAVFDKFDKDKSGTIDMWELRDALRELGQEPTVDELVEIIAEIDTDENGVIDFNDFIQLVGDQKVVLRSRDDDSDTLDAFIALGGSDDKTGHVRRELLARYVNCFGLPVGNKDMMQDMSTDESGLVDYETFKSMMLAGKPPSSRIDPTFQIGGKTFSWRLSAEKHVPWDTDRKGRSAPRYHVFGKSEAPLPPADPITSEGEPGKAGRMTTGMMEDAPIDDKDRRRRHEIRKQRLGPKYVSPLAEEKEEEKPAEVPRVSARAYESQFEIAALTGKPVEIKDSGNLFEAAEESTEIQEKQEQEQKNNVIKEEEEEEEEVKVEVEVKTADEIAEDIRGERDEA